MHLLKITVKRYLKGEVEFFCFCHQRRRAIEALEARPPRQYGDCG